MMGWGVQSWQDGDGQAVTSSSGLKYNCKHWVPCGLTKSRDGNVTNMSWSLPRLQDNYRLSL